MLLRYLSKGKVTNETRNIFAYGVMLGVGYALLIGYYLFYPGANSIFVKGIEKLTPHSDQEATLLLADPQLNNTQKP